MSSALYSTVVLVVVGADLIIPDVASHGKSRARPAPLGEPGCWWSSQPILLAQPANGFRQQFLRLLGVVFVSDGDS